MDNFNKHYCLLFFKTLFDFYNHNFVISEPVYNNIQPSKSFEKLWFTHIFYDSMLTLIPHSENGIVYDFSSTQKVILFTLFGRYWPKSNYKFVNESDYITIMNSLNFPVNANTVSQRKMINNFINHYVGYGLVTRKNDRYIIDTRHLQQFETREGYSKLNCVIYLDDKMQFEYCKINGKQRADNFAIRECLTAIITIVTIEKHFFGTHILIADKFNVLLDTIDKTNAIYRILIPITNDPYSAAENSSVTLFGETGFCSMFNFTKRGVIDYFKFFKRKFSLREHLIPKQFTGKSEIHKHQCLWFNCILNFVSQFLSIQESLDCDVFLQLVRKEYQGVYDKTKTKLMNVIDICTMMIYSNIIHECYSNSMISKMPQNPFTMSTTWKQNESSNIGDKINNLGEQTQINFVSYTTSLEAMRMDDERWINICCVNLSEEKIYRDFIDSISKLNIPQDVVLHPKNISSSISY